MDVADNTGAKVAWTIGVLGKNQRYAHVGDIVKVHIKDTHEIGAGPMSRWQCMHEVELA